MNRSQPQLLLVGRNAGRLALAIYLLTFFAGAALARVNVLTWHNDNARTGQNTNETTLTPANVNASSFGKLFSYTVDGQVYTQPLYVAGLQIPGQGGHNVVFIATQHNSVYAFDADSNSGTNGGLFWTVNFGPSATTPNNDFGNRYGPYHDVFPEIGITSTPVIDIASGRIYLDAFTHEGSSYFHRIHALNITNGVELPFSPAVVTATVPGGGVDNIGGIVTFNAPQQIQRCALTLAGGKLYASFAGYSDTDPYHGWVIGFNATNLAPLTNYVFNTTPNGTTATFGANAGEAGLWMSGSGLGVDAQTNLYAIIGNGNFNANTPGGTEYGNSAVKMGTTNGLKVADFFTPYNQKALSEADTDFGSGGPLLLPDSAGSLAHPHLMLACGKEGSIYLLDRDNLGHYSSTNGDTQIVQWLPDAIGGTFSTPAYFNQRVYFGGVADALKCYVLSSGQLSNSPASQSTNIIPWPGATPAISANGTSNAIVWAVQTDAAESGGSAILHAYDAYNLSNEVYNSSQAGIRDIPGAAVKFVVPTVANGKVYCGATRQLSVYGNGSFLATPVISPAGGYFIGAFPVTVTEASPGTTIYYTLDNSIPGTNSAVYTLPLALTNTTQLQVRAVKNGYVPSAVVGALFVNEASTNFVLGFAKQEFYPGALRTDLESPYYTGQPSFTNFVTAFETPSGQGFNYSERVSAYFIAPATTNYVFFLAADDDADLFLSSDAGTTNLHLIAQETGWSLPREWVSSSGSVVASKRSDQFAGTGWPGGNIIHLVAGQHYYLEGDHHQGPGGDNFAVTYKYATDPDPVDGAAPALTGPAIGVDALNTYINISNAPQNTVAIQNTTASFAVSATAGFLGSVSAPGLAISCQWQAAPAGSMNFTNVPGATGSNYTTGPLALAQNGGRFRAMLTTVGYVSNTTFAKVTVIRDTHTPVPVSVLSVSANARKLVVQFSETLDPASAQTATNYVITPGNIVGTNAVLDATGSNLTLTVGSVLSVGVNLKLTIANVKNLAGNAVLPGTALSFALGQNAAPGYPATVLADGPLAYWRLNETNGTTARDSTGAFNGTYSAGVTHGVAGPAPPLFAGFELTNTGTEFYYAQANSLVTVPALNLHTNTVTILAWLYPLGNQVNFAGLLMTRASGSNAGLGYTTTNQIGYTWNNDTTWTNQSHLTPPSNQWSLVALVISPTQAKMYLFNTNGFQSATNPIAHQNETWGGTAQIGNDASGANGARTFNGVMDEVAVFNKTLSFSALTALYQSGTNGGFTVTNNALLPANLRFTSVNVAAGQLILQWSSYGTLEETTNLTLPWQTSSNQANLQSVTGSKFYRLRR